jgi:hypothetical protein
MRTLLRLVVLLCLVSTPLRSQTVTRTFGRSTIALTLPAGYQLLGQASPDSSAITLGYGTERRPDGSRGLIQVTLIDLTKAPTGTPVSLQHLTESMIEGVHRRRAGWSQTDSSVMIDGVKANSIRWSGTNEPSPERPAQQPVAMMHGLMIVGIKGTVAFALHTQDVEPYSQTSLPECQKALLTFSLSTH